MAGTGTFRGMIDGDYSLTAYCGTRDCGWRHPLDLGAMARVHGTDHPSLHPDLRKIVYCPLCGEPAESFIVSPPTVRDPVTGRWRQR